MEDVSNQGEAEKCRDLAKGFFAKGQYEKAARFFQKSLQLHSLPGMRSTELITDKLTL
jgi:hypothetical protein